MIGSRREARERALTLLYEAESKGVGPGAIVAELPVEPEAFTVELIAGVELHQAEIDAEISQRSTGWPIERMPAIDRALLRMGIYELRWSPEVPPAVAINEAVELAKRFSTDDSGKFVNGLLSKVAESAGRIDPSA